MIITVRLFEAVDDGPGEGAEQHIGQRVEGEDEGRCSGRSRWAVIDEHRKGDHGQAVAHLRDELPQPEQDEVGVAVERGARLDHLGCFHGRSASLLGLRSLRTPCGEAGACLPPRRYSTPPRRTQKSVARTDEVLSLLYRAARRRCPFCTCTMPNDAEGTPIASRHG